MRKVLLTLFFASILYLILPQSTHAVCFIPDLSDKSCYKPSPDDSCPPLPANIPLAFTNEQSCENYVNNPGTLNSIPPANIITPAQPSPTPTSNPDQSEQATTPGAVTSNCPQVQGDTNSGYTLCPQLKDIDDTDPRVTVKFNNIDIPENAFVCLESDLCIDNKDIRKGIMGGDQSVFEAASLGLTLDDVDEAVIQRYKLVERSITVCGDGDKKLKAIGEEKNHPHYQGAEGKDPWWGKIGNGKQGCEDLRDYFHPGKSYTLAVYTKGTADEGNIWVLQAVAGFYVNHAFPGIYFSPPTEFKLNDAKFEVSLTSDKTKPNGNKDNLEYRNNYQVQFQGSGYSENRCGPLLGSEKEAAKSSVIFEPPDEMLRTGKFRITIKDQVNEDQFLYSYLGSKHIQFNDNLVDIADWLRLEKRVEATPSLLCQGGFVYRIYNCNISRMDKLGADGKPLYTSTCEQTSIPNPDYNPNDPNSKKTLKQNYIDDPNKVDVRGLLAYFDTLGGNAADTSYPCNIGGHTQKDPSGCKSLDTAIGKIPVDPIGFITRAFSIILSVAGVGALFVMIFAGYRLLISRGNPELIKAARESLTSAVIGLVFIIFSLVLLSIIANDILKIPGFN